MLMMEYITLVDLFSQFLYLALQSENFLRKSKDF